jgi:hypothetical protein
VTPAARPRVRHAGRLQDEFIKLGPIPLLNTDEVGYFLSSPRCQPALRTGLPQRADLEPVGGPDGLALLQRLDRNSRQLGRPP